MGNKNTEFWLVGKKLNDMFSRAENKARHYHTCVRTSVASFFKVDLWLVQWGVTFPHCTSFGFC